MPILSIAWMPYHKRRSSPKPVTENLNAEILGTSHLVTFRARSSPAAQAVGVLVLQGTGVQASAPKLFCTQSVQVPFFLLFGDRNLKCWVHGPSGVDVHITLLHRVQYYSRRYNPPSQDQLRLEEGLSGLLGVVLGSQSLRDHDFIPTRSLNLPCINPKQALKPF